MADKPEGVGDEDSTELGVFLEPTDLDESDFYDTNWLRAGRRKISRRAQKYPGYAEKLKENIPRIYYSFDWTPDDPEL